MIVPAVFNEINMKLLGVSYLENFWYASKLFCSSLPFVSRCMISKNIFGKVKDTYNGFLFLKDTFIV